MKRKMMRASITFRQRCSIEMKTSIASLQERLVDWVDWDMAAYQLGACLGFWPEFGGPVAYGADPWNGVKGVIWTSYGDALPYFLDSLVKMGCLERRTIPDIGYRWKPGFDFSDSNDMNV